MGWVFLLGCVRALAQQQYLLGAGISDVTGPAADVTLMGYAVPNQSAAGIHTRLWSRAFLFGDVNSPTNRFVYVASDVGMGGTLMKIKVVERLKKIYGNLYGHENVVISGSHSHSTPGGFLQYTLFQVPSLGFVPESLAANVDGIVESIQKAHDSARPGFVSVSVGKCYNCSVNRSPTSYLRNPEDERAMYEEDTDKEMVVLKLTDLKGNEFASVNWFAVHGTSMNNTNRRISGDNKGYASMMFEAWKNGPSARPGKGAFIAGFGQANLGDISPNTLGPRCIDSGLPCDLLHSTCHGKNELCIAFGPGKDMMDSTRIIGETQFNCAKTLYQKASQPFLQGDVAYRHTFVNMTSVQVTSDPAGNVTHTCFPAMGYAFAAGTTDGPGEFNFDQAENSTNPFWNFIAGFLSKPTKEDIECHWPKPILLNTGKIEKPYPWDPQIVPVQILQVGQLVIAAPPGELTTMAGRRVKRLIKSVLGDDKIVVIAGLSDTYASYITTIEEYFGQRYEAASTIYGPHTLTAYLQIFKDLSLAIKNGSRVPPGPDPPNLESKMITGLPDPEPDAVPFETHFGDVHVDVDTKRVYRTGDEVVAVFWTGSPRHSLFRNKPYFVIERQDASGNTIELDDGDWDTIFDWYRDHLLAEHNYAKLTWRVGQTTAVKAGKYVIRHYGVAKNNLGKVTPFQGVSSVFTVEP